MFENVPPPKPRQTNAGGHTNRHDTMATKARRAAVRAKKEADKELLSAKRKLQNTKDKVAKKNEALKQAEAVTTGKNAVITTTAIIQTPPKVREFLLDREIIFEPNPGPQTEFLASNEKEVFYGGARGGGKSYSLLVDPLRYCDKEKHRALLLRRTMPELRDLINHSLRLYAKAFPGTKWREQEKEWRFPSGARIEFGYAETRQDALRYQGQSYTWIGIDELPQFPTSDIWNDLRGSLRSVDPTIPEYMRATGNPGNIGSAWVKEMFMDPAEWGTRFSVPVNLPDGTTEYITRRFIPAKLADNPYLMRTKSYLTMLASLPEIQRKQWLDGNWDVWEGAAFPEFNREVHVCKPFEIPRSAIRFRAIDWGFSAPAVCLWFAVDFDNVVYVYREYKTTQTPVDEFARRVLQMEGRERISYGVMDSSVWARRGDVGPSIPEVMSKMGVRNRPSDRSPGSRMARKMETHRRLAVNPLTNQPSIKIFDTCKNLIKELPSLPLDENNCEDVDTKANDHSYDALSYGLMSRPIGPAYIDMMLHRLKETEFRPVDRKFGY